MAQNFQGRNDLPLGIRNNNPGNVRPSADKWQGATGTNAGFLTFSDISWGIRCWLITYHSYLVKHGIDDLQSFINRYAPGNENNTAAYIQAVSDATGLAPTDAMPTDQEGVTAVFRAMMHVENGKASEVISDDDIQAGFDRLGASLKLFFSLVKG